MNWYRHTGNIKAGLFILGLVLVGSLLVYSQGIVNKLRHDNREIVKLYAELIAKSVSDESDANLNFIFDEIIIKVQFPIIYAAADQTPVYYRNLPAGLSGEALAREQRAMDRQNEPIPLTFNAPQTNQVLTIGYLHYGDSVLIRRLQWLPYLEIGAVVLFVLLGLAGFTLIRNSEKRHIWVGLARETAHQLGTPVSALMGWVERLRSHPGQVDDIVAEMEADLKRLEQVGDRFSKMGSDTPLSTVNLSVLVEDVADYLRRRLPSRGKKITIRNEIDPAVTVAANGILISWALENVIKNGIDSITTPQGEILIRLIKKAPVVAIQIQDNGKGIPRRDWKNIFRPGYSSKEQGWGLGLSLTERIIREIHGGWIGVLDSTPGRGTTIEIRLPQSPS